MNYIFYLVAFGATTFLSRMLAPIFIRLAFETNLLDHPHGRKIHKKPTPFFGGVIIFISFWSVIFLGFFFAVLMDGYLSQSSHVPTILKNIMPWVPKILGVFLGNVLLLVLGIWDDRFNISPLVKIIGQSVAALILLLVGLQVNLAQPLGAFGYVITFVWIVIVMNAFNFIDSIDGHCTGIALISSGMFFWLTQLVGQSAVGLLVATFAGALFGFFKFNVKPAKCFLGDNGSLLIGYMLAVITLLCRYNAQPNSPLSPMIPILMFGVPIYDMISVIAVRLFRGIPPWQGDRNHFAHRLVKLGMGERTAALASYFIAATLGLVALLSTQVYTHLGNFLILMLFGCIISIIALLEYYAAIRIRLMEKMATVHRRRKEDIQEAEDQS